MAESGCLRDGKFDNLECNNLVNHGSAMDKLHDFLLGHKGSIADATGATITQDNGETGQSAGAHAPATVHLLVADAINTVEITAAAATMIHLPEAIAKTFLVAHITGDLDEANAMTINTNKAEDKFAHQHIHIKHTDNGGADHAASHYGVITAGTAAVPTSVNLIYTPGATATNCLSINSELHFFCPENGRWLVRVYGVSEGVGSTGILTVS
jgi:hypothetical protein